MRRLQQGIPGLPGGQLGAPYHVFGVTDYANELGFHYALWEDEHGSSRALTFEHDFPAGVPEGTVEEFSDYEDFGQLRFQEAAGTVNPPSYSGLAEFADPFSWNLFQFNGQITDFPSGMQYLRNRFYDPHVGQFIQSDTLDDLSNLGNRHTYCAGDPVNVTDPTGYYSIYVNQNDCTVTMAYSIQFKFDDSNGAWTEAEKDQWARTAEQELESTWSDQMVVVGKGKSRWFGTPKSCGGVWEVTQSPCPCGYGYTIILNIISQVEGWSVSEDAEVHVIKTTQAIAATDIGNSIAYLGNTDNTRQNYNGFGQSVISHEFGHLLGLKHPNSGAQGVPLNDPREYNDPKTNQPSQDLMGVGNNMIAEYYDQWREAVESEVPECGPYSVESK